MWRLAVSLFAATAVAVWPLPVSQSSGTGVLFIEPSVKITYQGPKGASSFDATLDAAPAQSSSSTFTNKIIANAISRTHDSLFSQNFVPWMFHPRMSNFEPSPSGAQTISSITLQQNKADPASIMKPEIGDVDESYTLSMPSSGAVTIAANSSIGLLYGLTTFSQLFYQHTSGGTYSPYAPTTISDTPKFGWRGLNVDTSRSYKPVPLLLKTIDVLSYNKFNRFHWHITDAQSWPLVIPSMPELSAKGAYVANQVYTPQDVQKIYEYGALNGVEVVMEIDMPGHTTAIGYAYPELIVAFNEQPDWTTYALEPPSGQLKLNSSKVSSFLEKMFDDLLPRIKPMSAYFHLGGDEVTTNVYNLQKSIRSNATSVIQPLLQQFMNRNQQQMKSANFTPLVWQEQLLTWNLTLPKNTIVQAWETSTAVQQIVSQGYQALVGDYDYWYLDCGHGQWLDFTQQQSAQYWPYLDYCDPLKNWRLMYSYDPLQGIPESQQHLVLGGETHIWSEQTDQYNFDPMVWPRACAAGEVLWSGAKDASGQNRSQVLASPRLNEMRWRLVNKGIQCAPPQMPFCTQGDNQCTLSP